MVFIREKYVFSWAAKRITKWPEMHAMVVVRCQLSHYAVLHFTRSHCYVIIFILSPSLSSLKHITFSSAFHFVIFYLLLWTSWNHALIDAPEDCFVKRKKKNDGFQKILLRITCDVTVIKIGDLCKALQKLFSFLCFSILLAGDSNNGCQFSGTMQLWRD